MRTSERERTKMQKNIVFDDRLSNRVSIGIIFRNLQLFNGIKKQFQTKDPLGKTGRVELKIKTA